MALASRQWFADASRVCLTASGPGMVPKSHRLNADAIKTHKARQWFPDSSRVYLTSSIGIRTGTVLKTIGGTPMLPKTRSDLCGGAWFRFVGWCR